MDRRTIRENTIYWFISFSFLPSTGLHTWKTSSEYAMFSHSPFAITYTGKRRKSIVLGGFFPTNTIWNLLGISLFFFFFLNSGWFIYCSPCYWESTPNTSLANWLAIFWLSITNFENTGLSKLKCPVQQQQQQLQDTGVVLCWILQDWSPARL